MQMGVLYKGGFGGRKSPFFFPPKNNCPKCDCPPSPTPLVQTRCIQNLFSSSRILYSIVHYCCAVSHQRVLQACTTHVQTNTNTHTHLRLNQPASSNKTDKSTTRKILEKMHIFSQIYSTACCN